MKKIIEYNYTTIATNNLSGGTIIPYTYPTAGWKDQLLSYNYETIEYDTLGNPLTYLNNNLAWSYGRQLDRFNDITYKYNADGVRTSKTVNGVTTQYFLDGTKILAQSNGNMLVFHYGSEGVIGFTYQGIGEYYYKKNIFGDVIGIIDNNGQEITKYIYDAWGNHKTFVLDNNQYVDISTHLDYTQSGLNNKTIALLNPFRYRSYYYDEETKLYYLNSRYYDPQIGRFINADDIPYLDKSNFNGLNLYTYCLNNPIKYADFWGNSILSLFIILLTTTIIGAVGNGIKAYNEGSRGWDLIGNILIGASFGLAAGGALIAVGAVVTGAIFRIGASLFGVGVSQAFAIGALAFNFTAYIVAPIIGIEMTGIEFENPNYEDSFTPSETNSSPSYIINLKLSLNCNPRSKNYDYLFRKFVKRL